MTILFIEAVRRKQMTNQEIMRIAIKPLTPDLADDYFDFFDNRAFSDNSPEGPCYCTRFQQTREQEQVELVAQAKIYDNGADFKPGSPGFMRTLREIAERQIKTGVLQGYLAFADGMAVGWCNANDRANFPRESANRAKLYAPAEKREKVVVCFEIAPNYRGKGVATALLQKVIDDAKAEGYIAVEANARIRTERYEWDHTGPLRLYEKLGFVPTEQVGNTVVMRRELRRDNL
jgi:GNAT superfamily N-acetyltransferase